MTSAGGISSCADAGCKRSFVFVVIITVIVIVDMYCVEKIEIIAFLKNFSSMSLPTSDRASSTNHTRKRKSREAMFQNLGSMRSV